jgi:hypothetical protein
MKNRYVFTPISALSLFLAILLMLIATACGGGGSSTAPGSNPSPTPGANSAVQVKVGDAPAARVVSFEVTAGPITMTSASGTSVTVMSTPRRIELTHLSGTSEPLALLNIPQGTYSSAAITVSHPEVSFVNSSGTVAKLQPSLSQVVTVNFSPTLSVGGSSSVVNIDLSVANALTFDAQGNVTGVSLSASSFVVSTSAVAAEDNQHAEDGELEDIAGVVTSVSGSSFTMKLGQSGVSLTFATDANTSFNDGASLATMNNTLVTVEGVTRSGGSLYAKEVEGIENANGMEFEGLVTQVTGSPANQLSLLPQDGSGSGVDDTTMGNASSVNVSGAQFKVNKGNIDTSGIGGLPSPPNFPFDASTIRAGQRVEIESASPFNGGVVAAEKVKLQQQAVVGIVSGLSGTTSSGPVTFTLTLPSDSAFAMLSGKSAVTVYWQPGTDLHKLSSVSNGDSVRVRGLVFFTGSSFNMIAHRIDQ